MIGIRGIVIYALWLCAVFSAVAVEAKTLSTDLEVAAGKWSVVRLLKMPAGARLAVKVTTDGEIAVLLLGRDATRSPLATEKALYQATVVDKAEFTVNVPEAGTYYLVLDNRAGKEARKLHVSADITPGNPAAAKTAARPGTLPRAIVSLKAKLRQAFVFKELRIDIAACGRANAYSGPQRVLICAEYISMLKNKLGTTGRVRDALLFTILHEIGHVLLRQWSYPFYANEEVADEMATMLMVMFNETKAARTQAEFFASISPDPEAEKKKRIDDRHPLSVQRARNILRWLRDPDFVRKWQTILVPHMQTALLHTLRRRPQPWTSVPLVEKEIANRK